MIAIEIKVDPLKATEPIKPTQVVLNLARFNELKENIEKLTNDVYRLRQLKGYSREMHQEKYTTRLHSWMWMLQRQLNQYGEPKWYWLIPGQSKGSSEEEKTRKSNTHFRCGYSTGSWIKNNMAKLNDGDYGEARPPKEAPVWTLDCGGPQRCRQGTRPDHYGHRSPRRLGKQSLSSGSLKQTHSGNELEVS